MHILTIFEQQATEVQEDKQNKGGSNNVKETDLKTVINRLKATYNKKYT